MLFVLDLTEVELASISKDRLSNAVGELVRARRTGHHIVSMGRNSAKWLKDNLDLSKRDMATLDQLAYEFTQVGALARRASVYIRLIANHLGDLKVDGNAINVSIDRLHIYRLFDRPILLVENLQWDGQLYKFLLDNHGDKHSCSRIAYDLQHGGGTEFPNVFKHHAALRHVICGVVDSDKDYPSGTNPSLEKLFAIRTDEGWPLCFPASPPCRELENCIPMELVIGLPTLKTHKTNAIVVKVDASEIAGSSDQFWLYFDIKEGLSIQRFTALDDKARDWLRAKLAAAGIDPEKQDIEGYGSKVPSQIFDGNKHQSELRRLTRQAKWCSVFDDFIKQIIWVFAASSPTGT
jgi:hypothetical protein